MSLVANKLGRVLRATRHKQSKHRYSPSPLRIAIRLISHIVIALSTIQAWLITKEK